MSTQKWCSYPGCRAFIFATLRDFGKYDWMGFQDGKREVKCYCPKHRKEGLAAMKEAMTNVGITHK